MQGSGETVNSPLLFPAADFLTDPPPVSRILLLLPPPISCTVREGMAGAIPIRDNRQAAGMRCDLLSALAHVARHF